MGCPRARLGIGVVMACYIDLPVCSELNTCNTRKVRLLYIFIFYIYIFIFLFFYFIIIMYTVYIIL